MDARCSTDDPISKEEGSEGGEHSVGHSNGAIDCQVKLDIPIYVVGEESVQKRRHRRPRLVDLNVTGQ